MTKPRTEQAATDTDVQPFETRAEDEEVLTSEMLVEEVSIDGMCGVY